MNDFATAFDVTDQDDPHTIDRTDDYETPTTESVTFVQSHILAGYRAQEPWNYCYSNLDGSTLELTTTQGSNIDQYSLVDIQGTVTNVDIDYYIDVGDPILFYFDYSK